MSGRIRSRKITRFALIWALVFVCAAVVWSAVLLFVRELLVEYEDVRPEHAAALVFDRYFRDGTGDSLAPYTGARISPLEKEDAAARYLDGILSGGELSYKEVIAADADVTMYAVSAGDVTFASFSLRDGATKTEILGLSYPDTAEISVTAKPLCGAVIYVPKNAAVWVNGTLLDEAYIEGDPVLLADAPYYPVDDPDARIMVNYSVGGLFFEPEIRVTRPESKETELVLERDGSVYSGVADYLTVLADRYNAAILEEQKLLEELEQERIRVEQERIRAEEERKRLEEEERLRVSEGIRADYEKFVLAMGEQYNKFIYYKTNQTVQDATKVYFQPGTDIYGYVTLGANGGYYNWSDYYVTKIGYSGETTSDYSWVDAAHTCFRCRVKMTVEMYGRNTETGQYYEDNEPFDMIAYVDLSGKTPLVYRLITPDADRAAEQEAQQ